MRRYAVPLVIAAGMIVMLVSLLLLSKSTANSAAFEHMHAGLLLVNAVAVLVLVIVIGWNLTRLVLQYRRNVTGSRLTTRLVVMFVLLAIVPVVLVYYFSVQFISRGIDSWFDVRVERALEDAIELSRSALQLRVRELLARTEQIGNTLAVTNPDNSALELDLLRRRSGAIELTLLSGADGHIISTSSALSAQLIPDLPGEQLLMQVRGGTSYVGLDPVGDNGLHIRALVPVTAGGLWWRPEILQAIFPVADQQSGLANQVQAAYSRYRELTVLRQPLKYSFMLTLSLVLVLSVLMAVWGAFVAARKLVEPIQNLVEGTRSVARGDFSTRLPLPSRDEVGYLVSSFNEMTQRLSLAQDAARRSRAQVESERSYLDAVLTRLSSGVISLDAKLTLKTANPAAGAVLDTDLSRYLNHSLAPLAAETSLSGQFVSACRKHLDAGETEWREEMLLHGATGRRMLMVSCTTLSGSGEAPGHVLVFDDLTALIEAQRDAAWGEVARRLAHEIKNPLTPIRLAAERLRRKYLGKLKDSDAEVLARSTHTIVQQVEAMKSMVDAFSEYARTPPLELAPLELNALIREVTEFYRVRESGMSIQLKLDDSLPAVNADSGRLRQMLHNLLKNAQEALEGHKAGYVKITTHYYHRGGEEWAEILVEDNGPGFNAEILGHAFEPYVTSKPKGTGLGLAIVKKLAEEHGGSIRAQNGPDGGALLNIRLPVTEESRRHALFGGLQRRSGA
ncbi:MAG: HAMP domain-containing protein [Gammaproteobacteria bacterium]|nr:HAMP domain-containing protein [Gammaproteobacteria bacterium]MBU6510010.1 HAMP domain-containing protein [Gammaproteobacteria bacterium]MDE1984196.1 HAMP domain-containing protein [Gammaproteobacteria bacterium]MDE2459925.1 HAMP domain-containing protein [Gammaproteobacteria bacterium]